MQNWPEKVADGVLWCTFFLFNLLQENSGEIASQREGLLSSRPAAGGLCSWRHTEGSMDVPRCLEARADETVLRALGLEFRSKEEDFETGKRVRGLVVTDES